jgi:hypothetical protein
MKTLDARFTKAAAVAEPRLVKAAIVYHDTPAGVLVACYMANQRFRDLVAELIQAKLI